MLSYPLEIKTYSDEKMGAYISNHGIFGVVFKLNHLDVENRNPEEALLKLSP